MKYILYSFFFLLLLSCSKTESNIGVTSAPHKKHTVILYAIADNNLYNYAEKNIQAIEKYWDNSFNGNFVVVLDAPDYVIRKRPSVFKVEKPNNIEILPNNPNFDTTDKFTMKNIISDIKKQYPSDKYTLILWSHATAWLPNNYELEQNRNIFTKSFGKNKEKELSIFDLEEIIPDNSFETIIFDACFMSSVEVLYQLRNKSKYTIASTAEILQTGFPYKELTLQLFDESKSPIDWAKSYFDYYNSQKGIYKSATISVIYNQYFKELETIMKKISIKEKNHIIINTQNIQKYDRLRESIFYDFYNYIEQFNLDNSKLNELKSILDKLVIYKANTETFAKKIIINKHSGLSTYILSDRTPKILLDEYKKYNWYNLLNTN